MLYPTSVLVGKNAASEFTGITFAGSDQYIDNGCANIHLAEKYIFSSYNKGYNKR